MGTARSGRELENMAQYMIKAGGNTAKINSLGAELCSFRTEDGTEYIWQGDPAVWGGHSPVLFPNVGSLVDGKVNVAGKEYTLPKHGPFRKMEFSVHKHGEDFIEMVVQPDDRTKAMYPFDFTLHVVHTVVKDGFSTSFVVENNSDVMMPMCIGGHPGFNCPMNKGEKFEDYRIVFEYTEEGTNTLAPDGYIVTGTETLPAFHNSDTLNLQHGYFDERDALIFDNLKSRKVRLIHKDTQKGIEFAFAKFDVLGVWTAPGKNADYVCLEPWCGLPALAGETGNMEDKPYVRILSPDESCKVDYRVTLI